MQLIKDRIIINGIGGSGKDYTVGILTEKLKALFPTLYVENYSTIDTIKAATTDCFGIYHTETKTSGERQLWSDIKQALIRFADLPFNWTIARSQQLDLLSPERNLMFIHCREGEEISKLVDRLGDRVLTLLVQRDGITVPDCTADRGVDNYYGYDYIIYNHKDTLSEVLDKLIIKMIQ